MSSIAERDLVVIDIETTGANPFKHDALAVALVPMSDKILPIQLFVAHTELQWNSFALSNFESFRDEWERDAIPAEGVCTRIEDYLRAGFGDRPVTLVGHNIGFDVAFLRKLAFQGGRDQLAGISHRAVDTHTLLYLLVMKGCLPAEAVTSDGAFRHFGLGLAAEKRHTALGDAMATKALFMRLLDILAIEQRPTAEAALRSRP